MNKLINGNVYIFIQENAFESVVRKMAAILSRPQCVNFIHSLDKELQLYEEWVEIKKTRCRCLGIH